MLTVFGSKYVFGSGADRDNYDHNQQDNGTDECRPMPPAIAGREMVFHSMAHLRRRIPAGPGDEGCSIPSRRQRRRAGAKEKRPGYGACGKNNGSQVRKIESLFASSLRRWGISGLIMLLRQRICNYLNILVEIEDRDCPTMTENRLPRMGSSASLTIQQRRIIPTEYPTRIRDMQSSWMLGARRVKPFEFPIPSFCNRTRLMLNVGFAPLILAIFRARRRSVMPLYF